MPRTRGCKQRAHRRSGRPGRSGRPERSGRPGQVYITSVPTHRRELREVRRRDGARRSKCEPAESASSEKKGGPPPGLRGGEPGSPDNKNGVGQGEGCAPSKAVGRPSAKQSTSHSTDRDRRDGELLFGARAVCEIGIRCATRAREAQLKVALHWCEH
eukprot:7189613-Prymnesium_polylepis.1